MNRLWRKLKYAGADGFGESDIPRAICIGVNTMCVSIFLLNLLAGLVFFLLSGKIMILVGSYAEGFLMLGIVALNHRRNYVLANILFYFVINLATFYFGSILGPFAQPQLMFLFILGLIFFVFDNLLSRIVCIGITLLLLTLLEIGFRHPFIPPITFSSGIQLLIRIVVYAVIISLTLLIFFLFKGNVLGFHSLSRKAEASRDAGENLHKIKNNFFQHISHDIRGAYFGVGSICAVIHEKVHTGHPVTPELAESLLLASQNYKYMLHHFLEFSRFKMGTVDEIEEENIDVAAEVKQIVQLNQYLALEKHIRVEFRIDDNFPSRLLTDRVKINRIFYNVFVNALKFSPPASCVRVCLAVHDDVWVLRVIDQGSGFHPEQLTRIFEPYSTNRGPENPEGIGLGLYITNYLTQQLGGEIKINSSPATGATVELHFPLHNNRA
ncbi:HAMP domain-containing sensor histidine kinase [Puia sp.]|jgi:signal transduction histidine kinase|uniref:sensor histidine kinase n=1 Tax=Puia sp. TaxID=2045100 RepID=UPI002F3F23C1